jgi:hypothetical protein
MDIFNADPRNIWNYKQNHPELGIRDCKEHGFSDAQLKIVRQSLLCRGINKWLAVRRDLIAYKKQIKHIVRQLNTEVYLAKQALGDQHCLVEHVEKGDKDIRDLLNYRQAQTDYIVKKELLKHYTEIRKTLKSMCNADRWQIWKGKKTKDMNTIWCSD